MTIRSQLSISPKKALFIKLGTGGVWEKECIEKEQTLRIGFSEFDHQDCLDRKWDIVRRYYQSINISPQWITTYLNQLSYFYESGDETLWITFYKQRLWWCFASDQFIGKGKELKARTVRDKWRCTDVNGKELIVDNLSGQLLQTQAYQSTICSVKAFDYLLKKINGIEIECVAEVRTSLDKLRADVSKLIRELSPKDFELFVDLLFRESGYQRIGMIGGPQKGKDIELLSPVTHERIMVQVKSSSDFDRYKIYEQYFLGIVGYDHFYYVVHSPDKKLDAYNPDCGKISIWKLNRLSELSINAGLVEWLMNKVS